MFKKIIQRLHLTQWVYQLGLKFRSSFQPMEEMDADQALRYLYSVSPDPNQSCLCLHPNRTPDCDLEVIVPCYNVENYVGECLESILSQQTSYSFFVTVINDGSTDRTRAVLKKYENHPAVRIIDQLNQGLSGARNAGIAQAHGRYLLFVDSDDVLLPGAIQTFLDLASQTGADVVDSGHIRFADPLQRGWKACLMRILYDVVQRTQALPCDLDSPRITGYPCGKVLKAELFHKVQFPQGYWFEDTIVWMILEPMCQRKVTSDRITFRYRMNPHSISHVATTRVKSVDTLYITLQLLKDRELLGLQFDRYQYENLVQQMRNNMFRCLSLSDQVKKAVFTIQRDLLVKPFADWQSEEPAHREIERLLRENRYEEFLWYCQWF